MDRYTRLELRAFESWMAKSDPLYRSSFEQLKPFGEAAIATGKAICLGLLAKFLFNEYLPHEPSVINSLLMVYAPLAAGVIAGVC